MVDINTLAQYNQKNVAWLTINNVNYVGQMITRRCLQFSAMQCFAGIKKEG